MVSGRGILARLMSKQHQIEIVQSFLSALEAGDIDRALGFCAPEIVYQNVPLPPARGITAFENQMRLFAKFCDAFEVKTHHIAANGSIVLTERTDAFIVRGARAAFWVCGTFEVREGKIVLWRDSFDWLNVSVKSLLAVPRALLGALTGKALSSAQRA
jgi:limonene-1,2-epoxide hydrolase